MAAPKYVLVTDHKAGFNAMDKKYSLSSKNIIDAMNEAANITQDDENLYCVCLYEKASKNVYKQILRGSNGISFHPESSSFILVRHTQKIGISSHEWYDVEFESN